MAKKIKQRNISNPEIPTGSFADIAFLLLVFFMLTTVIAINRGIFFKVPEQSDDETPPDKKNPAIYLYINQNGNLEIDNNPATLNSIFEYVKNKLEVNPNKPVIIHCSENQSYEKMVQVLDKVKQVEDRMWGDFNKGKPPKEQKKIKITIPSLAEADAFRPE